MWDLYLVAREKAYLEALADVRRESGRPHHLTALAVRDAVAILERLVVSNIVEPLAEVEVSGQRRRHFAAEANEQYFDSVLASRTCNRNGRARRSLARSNHLAAASQRSPYVMLLPSFNILLTPRK